MKIYYYLTVACIALFFCSCQKESMNTPVTTGSATPSVDASLKVATADITATLSGNQRKLPLYGFNGAIARGPSWANDTFRDSCISLGLKIIRYPGGSYSEFWDWKKGWFVDENASDIKSDNPFYTSKQKDDFGLNQLKRLVDEGHCEVVFTLNMVTKSLDNQLEMLKSAQALGMKVKWIELGNELNLPKSPGKQKFATAEAYGNTCNKWITSIKQQFPNVQIAVVGGNSNYSDDAKNWNSTVLARAPNADAMVMHFYASPVSVTDQSGMNFENIYNQFTNGFDRQGFSTVEKTKNIWLTEYNILWALSQDTSITSNVYTWGQSLATLLMTSTVTGFSNKIEMALNHNIANTSVFAAIETEKNTFKKLPNGIGMQMWLKAEDQMTNLQKISFQQGADKVEDYHFFGWKFSDNTGKYRIIVSNLTSAANTVDLSRIGGSNLASFTIKYADIKANLVKNNNAINEEKGTINADGILALPPYSVAVISN